MSTLKFKSIASGSRFQKSSFRMPEHVGENVVVLMEKNESFDFLKVPRSLKTFS